MQSSKDAQKKSTKRTPPPPDPVPGVSMEYLVNQLHQFALHLWVSKDEEGDTAKARAYRIAIEHIQTAILWLDTTK